MGLLNFAAESIMRAQVALSQSKAECRDAQERSTITDYIMRMDTMRLDILGTVEAHKHIDQIHAKRLDK